MYCYHEIVHNRLIVERFEAQGVVFVDDIADVPPGSPIMLSAHGSAPEVVAAAQERGSYVVDSVCPLVTKVHHEVRVRAGKGYRIVYVGHEGHEEAVGTMAVAPDADQPGRDGRRGRRPARLRRARGPARPDDAVAPRLGGVAVAVRERFPEVWSPGRSDLCFATTNRQSALMELAERCDAIVVIGSANSSNTAPSRSWPARPAARWCAGSTTPASSRASSRRRASSASRPARRRPNELVEQVIDRLAPRRGVEVVARDRRGRVLPAAAQAARAAGRHRDGGDRRCSAARWPTGRAIDDRRLSASDVLAALVAGCAAIRRARRKSVGRRGDLGQHPAAGVDHYPRPPGSDHHTWRWRNDVDVAIEEPTSQQGESDRI